MGKEKQEGGKNIPYGHISRKTKVLRLEDLVGARVVQDSLSVNTRLVRERTVTTAKDYN